MRLTGETSVRCLRGQKKECVKLKKQRGSHVVSNLLRQLSATDRLTHCWSHGLRETKRLAFFLSPESCLPLPWALFLCSANACRGCRLCWPPASPTTHCPAIQRRQRKIKRERNHLKKKEGCSLNAEAQQETLSVSLLRKSLKKTKNKKKNRTHPCLHHTQCTHIQKWAIIKALHSSHWYGSSGKEEHKNSGEGAICTETTWTIHSIRPLFGRGNCGDWRLNVGWSTWGQNQVKPGLNLQPTA